MICVSIQNKTLPEILEVLDAGVMMAEIRLDRCDLSDEEIEELFGNTDVPLVATCRGNARPLLKAIEAGAAYADLEVEAPPQDGKAVRRACNETGTLLIRSWHDFHGTPSAERLADAADRCKRFGADIVKIVTTAHSAENADRVLSLYEHFNAPLIAFAMGEEGRESRLECLRRGAPFTYAALTPDEAAAPGQIPYAEMVKAVYGDFRFLDTGEVEMPSSKSFAQRAIIAAALAEGESHLGGYSPCGDNEAALAVARSLGASVQVDGRTVTVRGIGAAPGKLHCDTVHTGESGFLTRMMIPLLAALSADPVKVTGEKTLLRRPLAGAHDMMASFGVSLREEPCGEPRPKARKIDCFVPLTVTGPLIPGRADVSGRDGSQLISGLLSALPLTGSRSTVFVHDPRSIPYMFITMDVLRKFGIQIDSEMEGDEEFLDTQDFSRCTGVTFRIPGGQRYHAADFDIEGDWSGAAGWMVAGAIFGRVQLSGLDTRSLQADLSIMDILSDAGASISQLDDPDGGSCGVVNVQMAPLQAFFTDATHCPDLFPVLSVLAAFCEGESHILGLGRLAHKETDRAKAILDMLASFGVEASASDDELIVKGMSLARRILTGRLLKGGRYASHGDHRMVMALSIASLGASSPVEIDDTACVAKSYPGFMELFKRYESIR